MKSLMDNYGICQHCKAFLSKENDTLVDLFDGRGPCQHECITTEEYRSYKYASVEAEILDTLSLCGMFDDSFGEQDTFGYVILFAEYNAILRYDSLGFASATFYDSPADTMAAWVASEDAWARFMGYC